MPHRALGQLERVVMRSSRKSSYRSYDAVCGGERRQNLYDVLHNVRSAEFVLAGETGVRRSVAL